MGNEFPLHSSKPFIFAHLGEDLALCGMDIGRVMAIHYAGHK